jgi:hypothetical protein
VRVHPVRVAIAALSLGVPCGAVAAQPADHRHAAVPTADSVALMVVAVGTHASPALFGRARTEGTLAQGMIMYRGSRVGGVLQASAMLNAEHWLMPNGEPTPAIWGEGFVDRRHPHTVVHEAMVSVQRPRGTVRGSLAVGRGVVPFGTDDPMVRPFVKYVANHHLAQILERVQFTGALRVRDHAAVEAALFNGDEPAGPLAAPRWSRVGDSFAVRGTIWPWRGALEVQGSVASVRSPENPDPVSFDQRKQSVSVRHSREGRYALAEWARTEERFRGRSLVDYASWLAEAMVPLGVVRAGVRIEQTTRPEEERVAPFRTIRPHVDNTILGLTRWRLVSGQVQVPARTVWRLHGALVGEATYAMSAPRIRPTIADPVDFIGARGAWHLTVALRLGIGSMPMRLGRYGAAAAPAGTLLPLGMVHGTSHAH